jgi:hypothetical protein
MAEILICYRKESTPFARRLTRFLSAHYGTAAAIAPLELDQDGSGCLEKNQRRMAACDLLLLLVDGSWQENTDKDPWFRQPADPGRLLLGAALVRKVRVVPVVMNSAALPPERELPGNLKILARLQSFALRQERWSQDVPMLARQLERMVSVRPAMDASKASSPRGGDRGRGFSALVETWVNLSKRFKKSLPKLLKKKEVPVMAERGGDSTDTTDPGIQVVHLGASAPSSVKPGDEFTARFVACLEEAEAQVEKILHQLSPTATTALDIKRCQWLPGTTVTVSLSGRWLLVEEPEQTFVWQGPHSLVDFDVILGDDAPLGNTILKFNVSIEGIRVAKLRMDLHISADGKADQSNTVATEAARSAFASYSSSDRQRVLDRLASVRISAGLEIFLDCLSLRPGEEWKVRLAEEIRSRDQFLLFWSKAAADSQWVTWEWQTALDQKGKASMQLHPLENNVPPPLKLADLHFGDVFIALRDSGM